MRTRRTAPMGGSEPRPGVVGALAKGDGHSLRAPPSQDTAQNRRDPRELISVSLIAGSPISALGWRGFVFCTGVLSKRCRWRRVPNADLIGAVSINVREE